MSRIKIKNFGPLKETVSAMDGWIDIEKVTVFTGNQGSGKSTVAKLVSTFTWMEKVLTRGDFKEKEFTAAKFKNNVTKPYVLHAEANAITKVAASSNSSKDATIYVTSAPCIECAKLIIQSGIKRVVYSEKYRVEDGCNLLRRAGVIIDYIEIND